MFGVESAALEEEKACGLPSPFDAVSAGAEVGRFKSEAAA